MTVGIAKIGRSFLASLAWFALAYVGFSALTYHRYMHAFGATNEHESLNSVIERFGSPDRVYGLYEVPGEPGHFRSVCGDGCVLRLEYDLPLTLGIQTLALDFDHQHKVISKGEMTSA